LDGAIISSKVIAELFPVKHLYNVTFDGELIVEHSRDPETDLARALRARGLTGMIDMQDGATGRLRSIINIEKAANALPAPKAPP
jgi:hypothetical protein